MCSVHAEIYAVEGGTSVVNMITLFNVKIVFKMFYR